MMTNNRVSGKVYRYPVVVVKMTDLDVIQRVATILGNSVYTDKKQYSKLGDKIQHRTQVSGVRAAEWMTIIRPYMGDRRKTKIDEILEEYGNIESTEIRRSRSCKESYWKNRGLE